jgi:UV DNA damage repair endonuclease
MGYPPSHWNKINIHVGGVYGDKQTTLERFATNFRRLSPALQARLTLENDDVASAYSITDLLPLHEKTGIPLVFDFHHYKFCPGVNCHKSFCTCSISTAAKFYHYEFCPGVKYHKSACTCLISTAANSAQV